MQQKKFLFLVKGVTIFSAIAIFFLVVLSCVQFAKIGAAKKKKTALENELSALNAKETSLKDSISRHKDLSFAEEYAREHLGYINDGDIIYEID